MENDRLNLERRVGFEEWKEHFLERLERQDKTLREWKLHVDSRLDTQDHLLRDIRDTFAASKAGARIITWAAGIGAAVAVIWANMHGK